MKIAIIGAGVSGLAIAKELSRNDFTIDIFEKSRGRGGRAGTKRVDNLNFDLGAQYLNSFDDEFQTVIEDMKKNNVVDIWNGKFGNLKEKYIEPIFLEDEIYVGVPKMGTLVHYIFDKSDISNIFFKTKITDTEIRADKWVLIDSDGKEYDNYDYVICSIPAVQAKDIFNNYKNVVSKLNKVQYTPRYAIAIMLNNKLDFEYDGLFIENKKRKNKAIRWIARNNSKPGRGSEEIWVIHTDKKWSAQNLERSNESILNYVIEEFKEIMDLEELNINKTYIHLWRYAIASTFLDENNLWIPDIKLGFCGDYFNGKNINSAYMSGLKLGIKLLNNI